MKHTVIWREEKEVKAIARIVSSEVLSLVAEGLVNFSGYMSDDHVSWLLEAPEATLLKEGTEILTIINKYR